MMTVLGASVRALLVASALSLLPVRDAAAAMRVHPGFQTMALWDASTGIHIDSAIWYPTRRFPKTVRYDDWTIPVSRRAPILPGKFPLVILSHDEAGSRFSHHTLAADLARREFIVAAMTHRHDNIDSIRHIFTLRQLEDRTTDISVLIDNLLRSSPVADSIDKDRIALVGFGPGATAAILIGGGRLDATGWRTYCETAKDQDAYCTRWSRPRMARMAADIDPGRSYADHRVKAVVAVAPGYGMMFSKSSLAEMRTPLLLVKAGMDHIDKPERHVDAIMAALPLAPAFEVLEQADRATLTAPCTPVMAKTLPDLCVPDRKADRSKTHVSLLDRVTRFLTVYLDFDILSRVKAGEH